MLQRKFTTELSRFLQEEPDKIMLVNGARQIGKSYLIRYVSQQQFAHYIEINLQADKEGARTFAAVAYLSRRKKYTGAGRQKCTENY